MILIRQQDSMQCGIACLVMVCRLWKECPQNSQTAISAKDIQRQLGRRHYQPVWEIELTNRKIRAKYENI